MPNKQITDGNYRYNFQGQEKDPETGMEAFELRLWDGRLGRWLSVDPAHQYSSPYLGMGNNPLSKIDPDGGTDGEADGPKDDYKLFKNGKIMLIKETEDNFDRLFSEDLSDNIIVKEGILGQFGNFKKIPDGTKTYYSSIVEQSKTNENEMLKLFKFVSDKSKSEFSLTFYESNKKDFIQLATFKAYSECPGFGSLGIPMENLKKTYHNHPGIVRDKEEYSMGIGVPHGNSDYGHAYYGKRMYPNYVYFPVSKRLHNVNKNGTNFVKKINNFKDLRNE